MYYLGSKEKYSKIINTLIADNFNNLSEYCEPFAGGLNIISSLEKVFDKYYINDLNADMYHLYIALRDDEKFIFRIEKAKADYNLKTQEEQSKMYYRVRNAFNKNRDPAYLFFLLHTTYQSQFRVNQKGEFNKSFGFRSKFVYDRDSLIKTKVILKKAIITNLDYKKSIENIDMTKSLFIFDPPYTDNSAYYSSVFNDIENLILCAKNTNSILFNFGIECDLNKIYLEDKFKFASERKKDKTKNRHFLYWNKL